jgi:hypothetical protein
MLRYVILRSGSPFVGALRAPPIVTGWGFPHSGRETSSGLSVGDFLRHVPSFGWTWLRRLTVGPLSRIYAPVPCDTYGCSL